MLPKRHQRTQSGVSNKKQNNLQDSKQINKDLQNQSEFSSYIKEHPLLRNPSLEHFKPKLAIHRKFNKSVSQAQLKPINQQQNDDGYSQNYTNQMQYKPLLSHLNPQNSVNQTSIPISNESSPMPRSLFSVNQQSRLSLQKQNSIMINQKDQVKQEFHRQKSVSILKQVLEESILRTAEDQLKRENVELQHLVKEMNEFRQALNNPSSDIDIRRYHLIKSQVIQLTRQNKALSDTVISQSKLVRETERIIHYLEEAVMLSSKKAELVYQKRRERLLEKKRQRMDEDEIQTLDEIREEQIKELFKSADPRNFIQKLKQNYHSAVNKERRIYNQNFHDHNPLIQNQMQNLNEFSQYNLSINLDQTQLFKCETNITDLFKHLNSLYDQLVLKNEFPTASQINDSLSLMRNSIDQLLLLGLLPVGQVQDNKQSTLLKNNTLINQQNYEQWSKYVSERVQRDAIPRFIPQTHEKFISLNSQFLHKDRLLKIIKTAKTSKQKSNKLMMNLINEVYQLENRQRAQLILLSRENTMTRNFQLEYQKHLEKFSEFIYDKYNNIARTFRDKFYRPYLSLKKSYEDCVLHDYSKKYINTFMEQFGKTQRDSFDPAFDEFYSKEGPDLKLNGRVQDLIRAFNSNQKLLMSNLNDYEKIMNQRLKKDQEYEDWCKKIDLEKIEKEKLKLQELEKDGLNQQEQSSGDDSITYENFINNISRGNSAQRRK
eukprot:403355965